MKKEAIKLTPKENFQLVAITAATGIGSVIAVLSFLQLRDTAPSWAYLTLAIGVAACALGNWRIVAFLRGVTARRNESAN